MTTTIDGDSTVTDPTTVTSNYTTQGEQYIYVDSSAGAITVTIASADITSGREIRIIDVGLNASTNNITIATEGTETFNPGGLSTLTLSVDGTYVDLFSDGSNLFSDRAEDKQSVSTDDATINTSLTYPGGLTVTADPLGWGEDADSPYSFSGANDASLTVTDTGFEEYFVVFDISGGEGLTSADVTLDFSGGSSYDFVTSADSRTANASTVTAIPSTANAQIFGTMYVIMGNNTAMAFCDMNVENLTTGVVSQIHGDSITDLTSITVDHANADSWSGSIEVFHR